MVTLSSIFVACQIIMLCPDISFTLGIRTFIMTLGSQIRPLYVDVSTFRTDIDGPAVFANRVQYPLFSPISRPMPWNPFIQRR